MSVWLLVFLLFSPIRQVDSIRLHFSPPPSQVLTDYETHNYKQTVIHEGGEVYSEIRSLNFLEINLNFRIFRDTDYLRRQHPLVRRLIDQYPVETINLREFLQHTARFLEEEIRYVDGDYPQDAAAVLFAKKANCIGYSNLLSVLLHAVGVENKLVKGFYLRRVGFRQWIPVPHRWVEIRLANGRRYFYDPQYHTFSSQYVVVRDDTDFTKVKKFKVSLIKQSREMVNQ